MERVAWRGRIAEGRKDEYIRKHDEIWPEMKAALKEAGVCDYTIFCDGDELFGYYECEKGAAFAVKTQAESPVVARWNEYMAGIVEIARDLVTGEKVSLREVFRLD